MSMTRTILSLVILCVASLAACGAQEPPPSDLTSPLPTATQPAQITELPTPSPVPDLPEEMLVPFRLEKPLRAGDIAVRGSGPPDVPIIIANVTLMGTPLIFGEIGPDGHFEFDLPAPLEENHRIGLALGDLTGTPWSEEMFRDPVSYGDEPQTVPQVGFFYDTSLVKP
jgi:predicted small lipoprotein YifL